MGYRRMTINDLKSIYRRWCDGQKISAISLAEGFDRKTVTNYIKNFKEAGLGVEQSALSEKGLHQRLITLLPNNERAHPVQESLARHIDEIIALVKDEDHPVKLKTAYRIIKRKYDLKGSYESFKVLVRKKVIKTKLKDVFPRLETEPGQETQIDYCFSGYHYDYQAKKRRKVNGFIGKLSASRLPYVEFVYSQDQESFVESNIRMLEFFGGTTRYITIDNLKAGVIKPHIYDPKLNRAYQEFAEHYGVFINPCVVGHSKGKAKVERQVQEVRELFRELIAVHPSFTLQELNEEAKKWCLEDYGMHKHGTTNRKPRLVFEEEEQPLLKPLNPIRFEVPHWKPVKVHADQFFSYDKKRYAMPAQYRGHGLLCRRTGKILKVYDTNHTLLRQYVITAQRVQYCKGDFPESYEAMLKGEYPQYLIRQAELLGPSSKKLIESILVPHAFIKARCARGVLSVLQEYKAHPFLQEICQKAREKRLFVPKTIKRILEQEKVQGHFDFIVPRSASGEKMIRDISEYIN